MRLGIPEKFRRQPAWHPQAQRSGKRPGRPSMRLFRKGAGGSVEPVLHRSQGLVRLNCLSSVLVVAECTRLCAAGPAHRSLPTLPGDQHPDIPLRTHPRKSVWAQSHAACVCVGPKPSGKYTIDQQSVVEGGCGFLTGAKYISRTNIKGPGEE